MYGLTIIIESILPCIVSDIRGNRDLIDDGKGGFLISPTDADGLAHAIENLIANPDEAKTMSRWNLNQIKDFDVDIVRKRIKEIYRELLH